MGIQHTSLEVGHLIAKVESREILLPEIQRAFVWKPAQIARLVDSLYRGYPSGSLLMWQTKAPPKAYALGHADAAQPAVASPWYLLDGQQRLTSLHRLFTGDPEAQVVFHLERESFQIQSAATRKDPKFVLVHAVLGATGLWDLVDILRLQLPALTPDQINKRLTRIKDIEKIRYEIDVLTDLSYQEATEVFLRVNSSGRRLSTSDLLLSTLSARWPGAMDKLSREAAALASRGFPDLDTGFLVRALAGAILERGLSHASYGGLAAVSDEELAHGWQVVQRGTADLEGLLRGNLGITSSKMLWSVNALIPPLIFLGTRPQEPLQAETRDTLLWWLLVATLTSRYSAAVDTMLRQDLPAALKGDGLHALVENLGPVGAAFRVQEQDLVGKRDRSAYFFLAYLVARARSAKDWWYGTPVDAAASGQKALQAHHIHPQATLRSLYKKSDIDDIANLAFISAQANQKISDRAPADYFPELSPEAFQGHLLPEDPTLRTAEAYPDFLSARRQRLAEAMNALLDAYRPRWLAPAEGPGTLRPLLRLTIHAGLDGQKRILVREQLGDRSWQGLVDPGELEQALLEAEDGLGGQITIADEPEPVERADDLIAVPLGLLEVFGSFAAWSDALGRLPVEATPVVDWHLLVCDPWVAATGRIAVQEVG